MNLGDNWSTIALLSNDTSSSSSSGNNSTAYIRDLWGSATSENALMYTVNIMNVRLFFSFLSFPLICSPWLFFVLANKTGHLRAAPRLGTRRQHCYPRRDDTVPATPTRLRLVRHRCLPTQVRER